MLFDTAIYLALTLGPVVVASILGLIVVVAFKGVNDGRGFAGRVGAVVGAIVGGLVWMAVGGVAPDNPPAPPAANAAWGMAWLFVGVILGLLVHLLSAASLPL